MSEAQNQRHLAKERNHYVLFLQIDGDMRQPPTGQLVLHTTLPPECRDELIALVDRWLTEGKA